MRDLLSDRVFQGALHGVDLSDLQRSVDDLNTKIDELEHRETKRVDKDLEIENFFSNLGWIK